ncbi:MAG: hypothetical protein ACK5JD_06180 [Mangrovibacterium sp.]
MNATTANRMNFLLQKNDDRINAAIPKEMRVLIKEVSARLKMSESNYIKMALAERLERDSNK